jgi:hypothetical protein
MSWLPRISLGLTIALTAEQAALMAQDKPLSDWLKSVPASKPSLILVGADGTIGSPQSGRARRRLIEGGLLKEACFNNRILETSFA